MINNFSFNSKTHDLWPVYETIKKFYPIGLRRNQGKGLYFNYPGLEEYERIIVENLHDLESFKERWGNFSVGLAEELELMHWPRSNGQAPSFSSAIVMKRETMGNSIHDKKINFSVSLLGDYYQIYGSDSVTIMEGKEGIYYPSVKVITASPFEEFEEIFKFVEKRIKEKYPNHKIIPIRVGQSIIDGLQVRYLDDENCSVNKALFNQQLSEERIKHYPRGNQLYGMDVWKKN